MNNHHLIKKVHSRSVALITVIVLVLAILSSFTVSCGSEPSPAPEPTPPPQIPLKPVPESTPAPSPSPTPSTSPQPSFTLQTGSTISIGELETIVGEVSNVEIIIVGLNNGLSGYDLVISLSDRTAAEIIDVELPDFGLLDVNKLSSSEVAIRAVDLRDIVPSGKSQALLATLKIQGVSLGTSNIDVVVNAMDDDDGNPMEPHILSGSIETVNIPSGSSSEIVCLKTDGEGLIDGSPIPGWNLIFGGPPAIATVTATSNPVGIHSGDRGVRVNGDYASGKEFDVVAKGIVTVNYRHYPRPGTSTNSMFALYGGNYPDHWHYLTLWKNDQDLWWISDEGVPHPSVASYSGQYTHIVISIDTNTGLFDVNIDEQLVHQGTVSNADKIGLSGIRYVAVHSGRGSGGTDSYFDDLIITSTGD